ncbi:hypothetical protein LJ725_12770 [Reyranella aquatilis]|uniref:KTSC domain-containing protein n=1 Tax=Reyranella aquatilis TaxID=2035356 RepID=A0ABS8KUV0_9HYPH|nr:hypothetical protein [Reyranella aquatilis]MCC8429845.1 hypothetical protein [Reyranella aquatilis]
MNLSVWRIAAALGVLAATALAQPVPIIEGGSHAELQKKFCAANPNIEHVLIAPATMFVDSHQIICDNGPYKLYRVVNAQDTDDFDYFLDPPFYAHGKRLGCDGKAGRSVRTVALNCRPL